MTKDEIVEGEIVDETSIAIHEQQMMKPELIDTETIIANIKAEKEIREALTKHLMEALVPKTDYYTVRKGGKNSLGKSGAEKVCFMFNLVPKYVILEKTVNKERAEYEMRCDMYNKITGKFSGSGVGSATSKEDKVVASMTKQGIKNVESVANNMLKIAKKRAYVDATLSSTMISFMFTQDLEDGYVGYDNSPASNKTPKDSTDNTKANKKLDAKTFIVVGGKYGGKQLLECPSKWINWVIDQLDSGEWDMTKRGYNNTEYIQMLQKALELKEADKAE